MEKTYFIGKEYVDKGNPHFETDQFMRWINLPGVAGMMNSPGIRWLNYSEIKSVPAVLILLTKTASSSYHNPWEDVVDLSNGKITYWGDAKADDNKKCEDFQGNRVLKKVYDELLQGNLDKIPPILHFSKPQRGKVVFNGLCVIEKMDLTWFEDKGKPVRNYRLELHILDLEEVPVSWLHRRITGDLSSAPKIWSDYVNKRKHSYLKIWKKKIRQREDQFPAEGTPEYKILNEISKLTPRQFEVLTVNVIEGIKGISHKITNTRYVRDGGFDFFGMFTLPFPLLYEINFKGEAKKFSPTRTVGAKDLSRLAARLGRGEYGIFITLSFFSIQAQEELYEDDYPIKLISGGDIINFLKEEKLISDGRIKKEWLDSIKSIS